MTRKEYIDNEFLKLFNDIILDMQKKSDIENTLTKDQLNKLSISKFLYSIGRLNNIQMLLRLYDTLSDENKNHLKGLDDGDDAIYENINL